ncbi:MAG: HAMP domain-containing histidine kinase [Oscillospiraceae bacterium]|jgi:signal transduction histidine kinase|nr:HAMP domain-containing histidine kinase [Oscillospiraceae bacterium]
MRKNNRTANIAGKYFDPNLDLSVQAFNLLAFGGAAAGIVAAITSLVTGIAVNVIANLSMSALALYFVHRAGKKNNYRFYYRLTVIIVFIAAFPYMFFMGGGYHSSMPCYFVFAFVFTALMLSGIDRILAITAEFVIYAGACLIAYFRPGTVNFFANETNLAIEMISGIIVSSALLLMVILLYIRIYDNRQERLMELDKLKTEFYQDMHHEMKTPLNVISSDVQAADDMMDFSMDKNYIREKLEHAQDEIIRLARMVENSLDLAAAQVGRRHMEPVDFAALLRTNAEAFRPLLERQGNTLSVQISDSLPKLTGNRDMLLQVIYNIMGNAAKHTRNGEITVSLNRAAAGGLEAAIRDTGEGIAPEILPHVWERGVTSNGTGYGLSICKAFVEDIHGGWIRIESKPGKGTAVTFALPLYNGESKMESGE